MRIFIIGPGGVGKSMSGKILSRLMNYDFIDLDVEFFNRIGDIGVYIDEYGYEQYCFKNSELFYELLGLYTKNVVFVLSSGFLVHKNLQSLVLKHKKTIESEGASILLLPSKLLEETRKIVVERQIMRGFGLNRDNEIEKINERFNSYKRFGDVKIFSYESPLTIANSMKKAIVSFNDVQKIL